MEPRTQKKEEEKKIREAFIKKKKNLKVGLDPTRTWAAYF